MINLQSQLKTIAKRELQRRNIFGEVVYVSFVSDNGCSLMKISFVTEEEPSVTLTGFDYMEHIDDEYYLYLPIDTYVYKK